MFTEKQPDIPLTRSPGPPAKRVAIIPAMMRKKFWLALIICSLSPAHGVAADTKPDTEVETILRDCVETEKRSPGIIVGIIEGGHNRIVAWGKPSERGGTLNGDTVFEIGSISKTFTATLLQEMVDRGEVALDDPAQKCLPETVKMPSRNGKVITLRQLATHTSGLPRLPSNMKPKDPENPYADYTVAQLYAFLTNCTLAGDPGARYEYSNLGMGLLGHILALKAGTNYEALLVKEICGPLKMDSTCITLTPKLTERLATGHNQGVAVKNWDIPTLAGAGAIRSTMNDMLKYIAANMGLTDAPLAKVMDKTHVIQNTAGSSEMSIGLAWHVRKKFGSEIVWHNGGTGGYHSFAGFEKSKGRGVVVLSNSATDIDDIGWHLLNPEYMLAKRPGRQSVKIDYSVYDRYAGQYEFAPGVILTVTRDGDCLMAQLSGQQKFEVYPESETNFFYTVVDAQLTFVTANGKTTHVILHQNGRDQKAKKRAE